MNVRKLAKSLGETLLGVAGCGIAVLAVIGIANLFVRYPLTSIAVLVGIIFALYWADNYNRSEDES